MAANAAVIAGMKDRPMLTPRATRIREISTIDVLELTSASGIVLRHRIETPQSATRPPPKRSVRRPAIGIATSAPRPWGPLSRPVSITFWPHLLVVEGDEDHRPKQRTAEPEGRQRRACKDAVGVQPDVEQRPVDTQRVRAEE